MLDDEDEGIAPIIIPTTSSKAKPPAEAPEPPRQMTPIDATAEDIVSRLTSHNVTDLVLLTMVSFVRINVFVEIFYILGNCIMQNLGD